MTNSSTEIEKFSRRRLLATSGAIGLAGVASASSAVNAQGAACAEDTLDKIKNAGVFNLGVREAAPPYGYKDANGKYVGFATDIAMIMYDAINKELGGNIKINYVPVTSQTRIPVLQSGTIDAEAGATVVTRARVKVVDFTLPHFVTATSLLVPDSSPIKVAADLAGKRIGVPQGGLEEALFRNANASNTFSSPVTTRGFPDHAQGATALQTGSLDGYASDEPILYDLANKVKGMRVVPLNMNAFVQALLIRQGSPKFKRLLDLTLADICSSGRWQELYDTYFGPKGANIPLSDVARTLVQLNSWPE
jgi:ABC-type amino acid transport substrate-binding protein